VSTALRPNTFDGEGGRGDPAPEVRQPAGPLDGVEAALARGQELGWEQLVQELVARGPDLRFAGLDDAALEDRLCRDASAITAAMCRWLELLAELVRRRVWADQGARTPGVWLSWRLGVDGSTAREYVRVALRLRDLPAVRDRFAEGTLSYSKVRAITRVAVTTSESQLLDWADHATAHQLETIVSGLRRAQRARGDEVAAGEDPRYRQQVRTLADGTAVMTVRGPVEDILALDGQLRALGDQLARERAGPSETDEAADDDAPTGPVSEDGEPTGPWPDPEGHSSDLPDDGPRQRTTAADRVDALVHAVAVAATAEVPIDTSGLDRHTLVVEVADEHLTTPPAPDGRPDPVPVRDTSGRLRAMDRRALRRLACEAGLVGARTGRDGTPLDVGRRSRRTSAALRRALHLRDRSCTYPGCHATRHLHAHHVALWSQDGPTDLANLALLCSFHHRYVHDHDIDIEVRADGRHRFSTATAEALPTVGAPPPAATYGLPGRDTATAEALLPPGEVDLRPFDVDTAVAVLLDSYTRTDPELTVAA
jgi:hypothetical protein